MSEADLMAQLRAAHSRIAELEAQRHANWKSAETFYADEQPAGAPRWHGGDEPHWAQVDDEGSVCCG